MATTSYFSGPINAGGYAPVTYGGPDFAHTMPFSLPTPPNPFGNVPGFNNPSSGCNPMPGGFNRIPFNRLPIDTRQPFYRGDIPQPNPGGGQNACWFCTGAGGGGGSGTRQPGFFIPPPDGGGTTGGGQTIITGGGSSGGSGQPTGPTLGGGTPGGGQGGVGGLDGGGGGTTTTPIGGGQPTGPILTGGPSGDVGPTQPIFINPIVPISTAPPIGQPTGPLYGPIAGPIIVQLPSAGPSGYTGPMPNIPGNFTPPVIPQFGALSGIGGLPGIGTTGIGVGGGKSPSDFGISFGPEGFQYAKAPPGFKSPAGTNVPGGGGSIGIGFGGFSGAPGGGVGI